MLRVMKVLRITVDAYCALMLLGMVLVLVLGAYYRYMLHSALYWSDSLAVNMFTWLLILGTAISVRHGSMFNVNLFMAKKRGLLFAQKLLIKAITLAVFGVVAATSAGLAYEQRNMLLMAFPGLFPTVNMTWVYISLPIAFSMMILEELIRTAKMISLYRQGADFSKE